MSLELVHSVDPKRPKPTPADLRERPDPIPCFDPATGEHLGDVPVHSPEQVAEVVARAHAAQRRWAETSFALRRRVLGHMLDHVLEHTDELVELICRDAGKTRENALVEVWPVCEKLRHTMTKGERWLKPERVSSGFLAHKSATIEFHPLGVVGIIAPWNYPLQNVLGPAVPALMAGNGVVLKVSEWTSWSAGRIERIFTEALEAEGQSPDLVRIVTGYAETGAALIGAGVDQVVFTGSVPNGRRVAATAAETLTPVILELGGKDPLIVCDDAHLEQAVHAAVGGAMISAGQNCLAPERLLVFPGIHGAFVGRLVELVSSFRQDAPLGPAGQKPVDVGAMTMPAQADHIERLVKDAVAQGAHVLVGGEKVTTEGGGVFFQPTVLDRVTADMAIAKEEVFGPVLLVIRVADEDHAVEVANGTPFGLSSCVFSRDAARARRIADRLQAGSTNINDFGLNYMAQDLPFGGVKDSGYGRLNGRDGIRGHTNQKAVIGDRFPLHIPSKLYPVKPGDYRRLRSVIQVLYRRGPAAKIRALGGFFRK